MDTSKMFSIPNENYNLPPQLKEARKMMRYASIFFLVAAVLYGLWGLWSIMQGLIWSAWGWGTWRIMQGVIYLVFGVIALLVKTKFEEDILYPLDRSQIKHVKDKSILYIILGFIFGMALAGIFAVLGYMKLDEVDTTSKTCPTCSSPLRYIEQYNQWYCDSCQDYKMPISPAQHEPQQPPQQQQGYQAQQPQQQQGGWEQQQEEQQPQQQGGWQESSQQQTPQQEQQQHGWGQTPTTTQQQEQPEQQQNSCPTCGQQLRYVQQYNRWWCDNCQEYK